jgi:coenzyme PQQ precursor peptide PqqA
MDRETSDSTAKPETRTEAPLGARSWSTPAFEVISLSCEITAYAPDDEPLF